MTPKWLQNPPRDPPEWVSPKSDLFLRILMPKVPHLGAKGTPNGSPKPPNASQNHKKSSKSALRRHLVTRLRKRTENDLLSDPPNPEKV